MLTTLDEVDLLHARLADVALLVNVLQQKAKTRKCGRIAKPGVTSKEHRQEVR